MLQGRLVDKRKFLRKKQKSPTTAEMRMRIWDALRKRKQFDPTKIRTKKDLIEQTRKAFGLKPGEKPTGKAKSVLNLIKKSDFWDKMKEQIVKQKSYKREGRIVRSYVRTKPRRWSEKEVKLLKELAGAGYRGKELVKRFQRMSPVSRTGSSILTKYYRLKKSNV